MTKTAAWPGIFVSSSCFDLIDLRAEVELFLRELGLVPLLSDRPSSEFEIDGYQNSVEICLANVRKSSCFLCVLSQRYGPRLGSFGFEDVSATHLEYRSAISAGIPIYMYVRDRLEADYATWKANKGAVDLKLPWVQRPRDFGLFDLIEEHSTLVETAPASNWKWTFRDSVELRQRIGFDLRRQSARATLKRMMEMGNLPLHALRFGSTFSLGGGAVYGVNVKVRNLGATPALDLTVSSEDAGDLWCGTLAPGEATPEIGLQLGTGPPARVTKKIVLHYGTSTGLAIEDEITVLYLSESTVRVAGTVKRLLDIPAVVIG